MTLLPYLAAAPAPYGPATPGSIPHPAPLRPHALYLSCSLLLSLGGWWAAGSPPPVPLRQLQASHQVEAPEDDTRNYIELFHEGVKQWNADCPPVNLEKESYDPIMHRKYGEDPMTQPYFDVDSWVEVAGPCKKGRVFGLSQHTFVSSSPSSVDVSSTATSNQKRYPDDLLVQEMHVLKNDMQKMSNSLEMIQQILQAMTTPHPSPAPSSSTSEHPPISQFALWN